MRKHDGRRHQFRRFVARVTEHQSLVAGALFGGLLAFSFAGVHALRDVGRLPGDDVHDENFVGVKHVVVVHVTDFADGVARELFDGSTLERLSSALVVISPPTTTMLLLA